MRSLAEQLPTAIRIAGNDYPVNWDWRSCMRIITMFESSELTDAEKLELSAELLYKKTPPQSGEVYEKAIIFLDGGECREDEGAGAAPARLYSFGQDAGLIYAAFRQSHGIDLGREELHWWEFCSLFLSLSEETLFCRVVSLRDRQRKGLLTPQERKQAAAMGNLIKLREEYSNEEKLAVESFLATVR